MSIVGVKELKNRLTQYLKKTKKGEEVIITEHGKPIAVIRSTEGPPPSSSLEARLIELSKEGKITFPRKKFLAKIPPIKIPGPLISSTVLEERE